MENTTKPTTSKFQNHPIRSIQKYDQTWYVTNDVCHALGIDDPQEAMNYIPLRSERTVIRNHDLNDYTDLLYSVVNEAGLKKLIHIVDDPKAKEFSDWMAAKPTKDEIIQDLQNKVNVLEELLMDGAGPAMAYPTLASYEERSVYASKLEEINRFNPGVIEDILVKVNSLHIEALGKTPLQATMETMQELSDNHQQEYQQALRHIGIDHDFFFDTDDDSLDFDLVLTSDDIAG